MDLVIRYSRDHGHEDPALALARRLFAEFDEAIMSLTLRPVASGEFSVDLDGERLHACHAPAEPPRPSQIIALIRQHRG